jgi:hypothetical protein
LKFQDMLEYHAALAPWAVFNVNRAKETPFMEPLDFMLQRRARLSIHEPTPAPATMQGRPAVLVAPVPPGGRYALPGERPPSRFAPGQSDGVIESYDAYAQAFWSGRVRRYGG